VTRPRAADDFGTIRARIEELRRERARMASAIAVSKAQQPNRIGMSTKSRLRNLERRQKEKSEGTPPPRVPTIFFRM